MKPVLMFDNDGTLVDTPRLIKASFTHAFSVYKPAYVLSEEELDSFLGPTLEDSFRKYFPEEKVPELVRCYKEHNDTVLPEVKAYPGVIECLKKWHEEGYRMAIVSTKHTPTLIRGLEYAGIDPEWFDALIGGEQISRPKPDPQGLYLACDAMGIPYENLVYVGDAVSDMEAAKAAGAAAIGYCEDEKRREKLRSAKPYAVVQDFKEIDNIIQKEDFL
jgi:phosphatidylglycerol:prolipoprotein diacylglycerol transferase